MGVSANIVEPLTFRKGEKNEGKKNYGKCDVNGVGLFVGNCRS